MSLKQLTPMRTIPEADNRKSFSTLSSIYKFGSVQFTDTLMSVRLTIQ